MELSSLRFFDAVATFGSISSAAHKLNTVQSNVTARIKKLEQEVGYPLFKRKSRGMELTPEGLALIPYAKRMMGFERQALDAVQDVGSAGGILSIGSMETTAAIHLPNWLREFHKLYPRVELSVQTGTTDHMIKQVLDCAVDVALVGGLIDDPDLLSFPVIEEELVLVSSLDEKPANVVLVFRGGCNYRARTLLWQRLNGKPNAKLMEYGSHDGILGCVRAGLGVTLLPRSLMEQPFYKGHYQLNSISSDIAKVTTSLIHRKDVPVSPTLNKLKNIILPPT